MLCNKELLKVQTRPIRDIGGPSELETLTANEKLGSANIINNNCI